MAEVETTRQVDKVVLRDDVLGNVLHAELYKTLREMLYENYREMEKKYFQKDSICFLCGKTTAYYYTEKRVAVILEKGTIQEFYLDLKRKHLDKKAVVDLFGKKCPSDILQYIKTGKKYGEGHWIGFENGSYCVETERFADWNDGDSVQVGVVDIGSVDFQNAVRTQKYQILDYEIFQKVIKLLKNRSILETEDKSKCLSEKEIDRLQTILGLNRTQIEIEVSKKLASNFTLSPELIDTYTAGLLACDKVRADLEVYDKKCLEDVNSGHWELWSYEAPKAEDGQVLVSLKKPLIARNPAADIHEDGLIGIDFGTKSTIVSKRDGRAKTTLLRVGTGQLSKKAEAQHYENPTIMEFIDLEKFLKSYGTRNGRPETSIDDLRVSHTANYDLKSCTISDNFYSFFYDIKQWCGNKNRSVKIIDQKGVERVLSPFTSLKESAFNPLELYAYYLGLYINNMRNGIYLDYVLSFPTTYEKTVKEKIQKSFEIGLKKSLPDSILKNAEIMAKFRVRQGVSEPAAYAITALQGYGFEPDEGENVFYAIFDFGGGTTDFDFGLWRCADDSKREERRYDYVINHFGSEGDRYLGGENLLELLAFEVFRANADLLGGDKKGSSGDAVGFSFSKPQECDAFPGSEMLISDSQEAKRNTKQLMEVLRPFWEGIIGIDSKTAAPANAPAAPKSNAAKDAETVSYNGYIFRNDEICTFPINDGTITVDLFDKEGKRKSNFKLYVENKDRNIQLNLAEVLEKRIERGVSNFFTSICKAFRNESLQQSGVNEIQIFLAGNSSKSPILRKLFDKYIKENNDSFREVSGGSHFYLFPPLGTKEAIAIQREKGIRVDENDITAPTGKTGVAYGLITGREGGKIKVISEIKADEQTKFRFNIGIEKRGKFKMVLDRTLVAYGQWVCLTDASVEDFEIYYTSLPNAAKMSIDETGIYNKRCRLPYTSDNADVFIRCVEDAPEDMEYCISEGEPSAAPAGVVRVHLGE